MLWIGGEWIIIIIRRIAALGYMTPATYAATCIGPDSATLRQPQCGVK